MKIIKHTKIHRIWLNPNCITFFTAFFSDILAGLMHTSFSIPIFSRSVWCNCWCWGVFIVNVLVVLIPLTVSNIGCESMSCIFALV